LICAKFGKDLFNISKVIGRKTKWPRFLAYPVYYMSVSHSKAIARVHAVHFDECKRLPTLRPSQLTWAVSPPV